MNEIKHEERPANGLEILDKSRSWPAEQNSYYVGHLKSVSRLKHFLTSQ